MAEMESSSSAEEVLSLAVIGHVDAGKSTVCGHLLQRIGAVDEETMAKFEAESKALGRPTFKYAWVFDRQPREREKGVTIDCTKIPFSSPKCHFSITDAPGHKDFIKNMITGTSGADTALLVVSAEEGEFEESISSDGQACEHALLSFVVGVRHITVVVNKMDSVKYSRDRFNFVVEKVANLLKNIGFRVCCPAERKFCPTIETKSDDENEVMFVPVSGWNGLNLDTSSELLDWYDGPTLLQALEVVYGAVTHQRAGRKQHLRELPLCMPIQDIFKLKIGPEVLVGKVETGELRIGDELTICPSATRVRVESIQVNQVDVDCAGPLAYLGVCIRRLDESSPKSAIRRGSVMMGGKNGAEGEKEFQVLAFNARIVILNHSGQVHRGYAPIMDIHTAHLPCKIEHIHHILNVNDGSILKKNPRFLRNGDTAICRIRPLKAVYVEAFSRVHSLGRFAIRDNRRIIGVGIIVDVLK